MSIWFYNTPFIKIEGIPAQCFPGCGDDIIIGVNRNRVMFKCVKILNTK